MKTTIGVFVALVIIAIVAISSLLNRDELKRLQELKNKRRFGGKALPQAEAEELNALQRKYPWY